LKKRKLKIKKFPDCLGFYPSIDAVSKVIKQLGVSRFILFIGAICLFSACNGRPSYVLSDKKMANVLYDLYIAEVEIDENYSTFSNDSARKQDLLNSVLKKHKISEATFDTSLVWYNKNTDNYVKINKKVSERFAALSETLKKEADRIDEAIRIASIYNLFPDTTSFFLQTPGLFQNRYTYRTSNSRLSESKIYYLNLDVLGVTDSIHPVLSLCLQTTDTVFFNRDTIRVNGHYAKSFSVPDKYIVKEIYGSFSIPDNNKALILFHNISLLKDDALNPKITKTQEKPTLY
jgi:hypothetical protein